MRKGKNVRPRDRQEHNTVHCGINPSDHSIPIKTGINLLSIVSNRGEPVSTVSSIEHSKDFIDLSISAKDDIWDIAGESPQAAKQSKKKKTHPDKSELLRRKTEYFVEGEAPAKVSLPADITVLPKRKITLRPLLLSQNIKEIISVMDIVDIFHSVLDLAKKSDARKNRMEDTLRVIRKVDNIDNIDLRVCL